MADDTSRRRFLELAGLTAAGAVAGCGGNAPDQTDTPTDTDTDVMDDETATPTPTPEPDELTYTGGTLQMASSGPIQTLDPVNAKGSGAGFNQYGESLMTFPNGDLPPQPSLATGYAISDDGRTYTFDLKEGVRYHDGQEFTAQDIVYSWERLAGAKDTRNADDIVGSTFRIEHEGDTSESVTNYEPGSLAVEAVDDYTFRFTLAEPFHGALSQIAGGAFAVIPENSVMYPRDYEDRGMDEPLYDGEYEYNQFFSTADDGPKFVSTGPFQVDAWSKGNKLELTAFEDYHGKGPLIDGVTYTVIGKTDTRFRRFKNGNLDVTTSIPLAKFDPSRASIERDRGSYQVGTYELDNGETVRYGNVTVLDTDYIIFNTKRTPRPVRRAFAYLLNQHQLTQDVFKGTSTPAYHITPSPVFPHRQGEEPTEIYDRHAKEGFRSETAFGADGYPYGYAESLIPEARQVMADAGYGEDNRYSVEFTVFSGSSTWDKIAKRLSDKAKAAYIDVDIVKADFGTIINKAINGDMDMFSLGDGMEWPESDNFLRFLHPYDDPAFMFTKWTHEDKSKWNDFQRQADSAWYDLYVPNKGPGTEAQQKRNKAYRIIEEMNWASVQELPIGHPTEQRFWWPYVEQRMMGTMEDQTFNTLMLNNQE